MEKIEVLVTGGAGYIGSHTVVELIAAGYQPIIVDDFRNSQKWIVDRLEEITGQKMVCYNFDCHSEPQMKEVFQKHPSISAVIHFAADKAVGESVQLPLKYYQNNVGSTANVLQVMQDAGIEHFVFSSSCTVYGEPQDPIVTESTPIQKAASPYGATKIVCEQMTEFAVASGANIKATLLRYFNPIGAHPSSKIGELPQGIPNNLVPYITQTAKGIRKQLTVYGNDYNTVDGTCIRDYIHVVDLAKAHVKAMERSLKIKEPRCDAFNIGTGKGSTVLEIIHTFEEVNNLKLPYKIGQRREGDVEQIWADVTKAKTELNWEAEYGIKEALKHSWQWEQSID